CAAHPFAQSRWREGTCNLPPRRRSFRLMPKTPALLLSILLITLQNTAELQPESFAKCDAAINQAVAENKCPGVVLLVDQGDQTVYLKAYGHRALEPQPVDMTPDTIFDLASLSKTIGCAPSIMILADRGKLNVHDRVAKY